MIFSGNLEIQKGQEWCPTSQKKTCQLRSLYSITLSVIIEEKRKIFYDKHIFKEFMPVKPALQRILEGMLISEEKIKHT